MCNDDTDCDFFGSCWKATTWVIACKCLKDCCRPDSSMGYKNTSQRDAATIESLTTMEQPVAVAMERSMKF